MKVSKDSLGEVIAWIVVSIIISLIIVGSTVYVSSEYKGCTSEYEITTVTDILSVSVSLNNKACVVDTDKGKAILTDNSCNVNIGDTLERIVLHDCVRDQPQKAWSLK